MRARRTKHNKNPKTYNTSVFRPRARKENATKRYDFVASEGKLRLNVFWWCLIHIRNTHKHKRI